MKIALIESLNPQLEVVRRAPESADGATASRLLRVVAPHYIDRAASIG